MKRETLLDFFNERVQSDAEFLIYDDGYRVRHFSYDLVRRTAFDFAARLASTGIGAGEKALLWGENRPEWSVAFWGCLLRGVVTVPIDYRASPDFLRKVAVLVDARVLLIGDEVTVPPGLDLEGWRLSQLGTPPRQPVPAGDPAFEHRASKDDLAEIIFTSGATSEPKGVIITHRNILAIIVPVEREVLK